MKTAVIALGGNAILRAHEKGTKEEQMRNIEITSNYLVELVKEKYDIVLTHGNGPQVGNILLQNELQDMVPKMPLDVCGAESQGQIGYMLQQVIGNKLRQEGLPVQIVSLITQVIVDKNDKEFENPTKPIGPYYSKDDAMKLMKEKGWKMVEDKVRGGWRRVVPSPKPFGIVEKEVIKRLIFTGEFSGIIVIASGGGGIPVIQTEKGYEGVEAVIDKDLAASVLATEIGEKLFIILTDVEKVALNFGKKNQINIDRMTLDEAKKYYDEGHFPPGSMGPKIQAAINFLNSGGEKVIITLPENLLKAVKEETGCTIITK